MRWLTLLLLWAAAVIVAVVILRRVRRGKPVVLTGKWSPRLVRMIAVVLVVVGANEETRTPEATAAPAKLPVRSSDDELPKSVNPSTIQMWLTIHNEDGPFTPGRRFLIQALGGRKLVGRDESVARDHARFLGPKMQALLTADLAAIADGKAVPKVAAADIRAALEDLEKDGRYDHYWNAYLWRKTATAEFPDADSRIQLYARFRQHARITDALIRAQAQVKPLMQPPRAWGSKAGPRPEQLQAMRTYETSLTDMMTVAREVLPTTDEGTWKRDGVALIKPVAGVEAPVMIRGGKQRVVPTDESTRFGRLDLLKTSDKPATIVHDWLGKIDLPAGRLVSAWDLPKLLPDAAKQKLDETVHEALKNNSEEATDRLEQCLALSHFAIRAGLRELPNAKGAPRMRLILALFDDTPMPGLPVLRTGEVIDEFGPGLRGLRGGPGR
jgi:hypothetical protein